MADSVKVETEKRRVHVNVSGVQPVLMGDNEDCSWFVIDRSGDFSVDKDITATIWITGGGCDGDSAAGDGNLNWVSGKGGDGGYARELGSFDIKQGQTLTAVIAAVNEKSGTSLTIDDYTYNCGNGDHTSAVGGTNETLVLDGTEKTLQQKQAKVVSYGTRKGENGIKTPYGYIGSSGGGGLICCNISRVEVAKGGEGAGDGRDHRSDGTPATNYGCAGGGGSVCIPLINGGGKGKGGCVVVSYLLEEEVLVVLRHHKRVTNIKKRCNTTYYQNCCHTSRCGNGGSNVSNALDYNGSIPISKSSSGK